MKELNEAIRIYGRGIGKDIVKVDMFLNHRIDTGLLFRMGEELAAHFRRQRPTMVLTVEASGIPLATAAAHALGDIPLVFAKKASASNQSADQMATAPVHSYTHNTDNLIRVDRRFIPIGSRVLNVDDFLATGAALIGLREQLYQRRDYPLPFAVIRDGFITNKGNAETFLFGRAVERLIAERNRQFVCRQRFKRLRRGCARNIRQLVIHVHHEQLLFGKILRPCPFVVHGSAAL